MTVRMGDRYVDGAGTLTQAGYSALRDTETAVARIQTATSFVKLQPSVAAASQTTLVQEDVPSWANRITVNVSALSTNGTSRVLLQLGTTSGYTFTGYDCTDTGLGALAVNTVDSTAGWGWTPTAATDTTSGSITLNRVSGNRWAGGGTVRRASGAATMTTGGIAMADVVTRVRLATANSIDTFDAGSVSFSWE